MTTRLRSVNPLQLGLFIACLYLLLGLITALLMGPLLTMMAASMHMPMPMSMGFGTIIFMTFFYAVFGFVGGIISAFMYNLVASLTGGVELTFEGTAVPAAGTAIVS